MIVDDMTYHIMIIDIMFHFFFILPSIYSTASFILLLIMFFFKIVLVIQLIYLCNLSSVYSTHCPVLFLFLSLFFTFVFCNILCCPSENGL